MIQPNISRKGITPVVATVLLITISVAATASAYTFITKTQKQVGESFEQDLNQEERRMQSDINIEYAYNSTGRFVFMNVRNTGSVTLPVNKSGRKYLTLYADGRPVSSSAGDNGQGWKYADPSHDISNEDHLDPEELLTINTTVRFPSSGNSKSFKLVGSYDTSDSHVCYNSGTASC